MSETSLPRPGRFRGLYYVQQGNGRPVIALHGFGQTSYSWRHLVSNAPDDLALYVFDLRGFGASDKPHDEHYALQDQADLICAFIDEHNLVDVTLVGHSMGGGVALLATLHLLNQHGRVSSLVLIDSMALPQQIPWFIRVARNSIVGPLALACAPSRLVYRAIMHEAYYDAGLIERDAINAYAENLATAAGRYAVHKTAQFIVPHNIDRIVASYSEIDIPALIVWGENDRIIPKDKGALLHAAIPGSRLIVLEKCGHIPHEERPELAIPAIRTFLQNPAF